MPSCIHAGGLRASLSSSVVRSKGLCGATSPANTAQKTQTAAIAAARIAIGEVRKLWPTSLSNQRESCFRERGRAGRAGHGAPATSFLTVIHLKA